MAINKKFHSTQQKSDLGKFAGMHGTIYKSQVEPAKPIKGVVGKGLPKTCNSSITEQMSARSLREYELKQAAANGEQVDPEPLVDELGEADDGGEDAAAVA